MSFIKSSLSFAERGNMSIKSTPSEKFHDEEKSTFSIFTSRNILFLIFGCAYIFSFLLNVRVIFIVYSRLSDKIKTRFSVSVLVAHLSLICIGITVLSVLNACQSENLLNLVGPRICQVSDFLKDSFICAFSLNTVLLVYERVRSIPDFHDGLHVFRVISLLWSLAATQGFFTMGLTYHMKLKLSDFKLGAQIAGTACEVFRLLTFHLGVGIYVAYALVKVHSKLAQLPMPCQRLKAKMENILSFYFHLGFFIIAWITYGVYCSALRLAFYLEFDLESYSKLIDYIDLGFHTYLCFNPMIHVHLLDNHITACPNSYLCGKGHYKSDDHFEEETVSEIMNDEPNTTVGNTSPGVIEDDRQGNIPSCSTTLLRDLSTSPIKYGRHHYNPPPQIYVRKVHLVDVLDIEYIDAGSACSESSEKVEEYELWGKQTKVRFCDQDDIAYDEEEHLDDSEEKGTKSGECDTSDAKSMETAL